MEIPQEDLSLQEQMLDPQELAKRKNEAAAAMRNSLNKWNSEREKNEEGKINLGGKINIGKIYRKIATSFTGKRGKR